MFRKLLLTAVLPLVCLCLYPHAAFSDLPDYPCHYVQNPPVIDGNIAEDPVWQALPAVTGFSVLGGGFSDGKQTTVQACWDDAAVYIAFRCEEPDYAHINFTVSDGGDVWLDDGVEIFLQPGDIKHQVYQFVITARGARGAGEGSPDFTRVQVAAAHDETGYTLEIAIPHQALEASPAQGDRWRGNFCRNIFISRTRADRFTSWAPLKQRFMEPENFAGFVLLGEAPAPQALHGINNTINRGYRMYLQGQLEAIMDQSAEYLPVLQEAVADPEYANTARRLRNQWRQKQRIVSETEKSSVWELRSSLQDADSLLEASYQLKYRYLIKQVLSNPNP